MSRNYSESDIRTAHTQGFLEGQKAARAAMRSRGKPATVDVSGKDQSPGERILNSVPAGSTPQTLDAESWVAHLGLPTKGAKAASTLSTYRSALMGMSRAKHGRVIYNKASKTFTVNPPPA